jgi:hypothetical protein
LNQKDAVTTTFSPVSPVSPVSQIVPAWNIERPFEEPSEARS